MKWCAANALIAVGDRKWQRLTPSDSPALPQLVRSQTGRVGGGGVMGGGGRGEDAEEAALSATMGL